MAIPKILTIPDPFLKKIVMPVTDIDRNVTAAAAAMVEALHYFPHCVGIAAPQLGLDLRLIAVNVSLYPKKHPNRGEIILINPSIVSSGGKHTSREGCLSVPDFTGNVTRAEDITVCGTGLKGENIQFSTNGFEAIVLQHEIDHLDGILFLDRVSSLKTDVFRRKQVCLPLKK